MEPTQSHNAHNINYGEMTSRIFETYNNIFISNCCHVYKTAPDLHMATMFPFPSDQHFLPCCRFWFRICCGNMIEQFFNILLVILVITNIFLL